jgi:hypothetical protein
MSGIEGKVVVITGASSEARPLRSCSLNAVRRSYSTRADWIALRLSLTVSRERVEGRSIHART